MNMRKTITAYIHNDRDGDLSGLGYALHVAEIKGLTLKETLDTVLEVKYINYGIEHESIGDIRDLKGKDVIFMDFTPPMDLILSIKMVAKTLEIYDHHRLDDDRLNLPFMYHDYSEAGCSLVWRHFQYDNPPMLIEEGRNRDLFQKQKDTDYIHLATSAIVNMCNTPQDAILALAPFLDEDKCRDELIPMGKLLMPSYLGLMHMDGAIVKSGVAVIENLNSTITSDLGYYLYQRTDVDVVLMHYPKGDKGTGYALRTNLEDIDLSTFAKMRKGGGGHPKACGFTSHESPADVFEKLVDFCNN